MSPDRAPAPRRTVELVPRRGTWVPARRNPRGLTRPLRDLLGPPVLGRYLAPGELTVIRTRRHWLVALRAVAQASVAMPLVLALALVLNFVASGVWWLQVLLLLGSVAHQGMLFYRVLEWRAELIVVTDRRLIRIHGVLSTTVDDIRLGQITDSTYRQTLVGHVFGYGSIRIESAGQTQAVEQLDYVPNPQAVYRATLP